MAVNCVVFGTSGHQTPPPGLVIENYTRRLGLERPRTKIVKTVIDPERVDQRRQQRPLLRLPATARRR